MKFRQFSNAARIFDEMGQHKRLALKRRIGITLGRQLVIFIARQAGYTNRLNLLLSAFR